MELWFEQAGDGPSVLFLHAAIGDARMWDPQWDAFRPSCRVVRCDFRGFGRTGLEAGTFSHCDDVLNVMDQLGIEQTVVVGASMGGRVAMELAIRDPDRVRGLVVVSTGLPEHAWSPAVQSFSRAEDDALERGDVETAVELNLSFWLDGPSRTRAFVDDNTRALVADMQRTAIRHFLPHLDDADERPAVAHLADRLADIAVPTLVVVGDQDAVDITEIATSVASIIPLAHLRVITDTAHLPSLEASETFNRLLAEFLTQLP